MPEGYYQVPGLPYPRPRVPSTMEADIPEIFDPAMSRDRGIGVAPPRDPAMLALPPVENKPAAPAVTVLQPSRTTPFSRADAQALAALDPRALEEAKSLAALPESTPAKMTATFGGKNFEMQPSARVDRNALARLYSQAQERKMQERQDAVRGQEQSGKLALVEAPGKQLTEREKMRLETEERMLGKKQEFEMPERDARVSEAQLRADLSRQGAERESASFKERITPQQAAIDEALAQAQASPFAQTPEGRARISALFRQSTAGKALPPNEVGPISQGAAGPGPDVGTAVANVMADPGISALIERAKETKPGVFTGGRGRSTGAAARTLAESAITDRLIRAGVPQSEVRNLITSLLGATEYDAFMASRK